MVRAGFVTVWVMVLVVAGGQRARGQAGPAQPVSAGNEDCMRPTEAGLRLTPGIARAIGGIVAKGIKSEYGLDEAAQKKAAEAIARRMMEAAHKNQKQAQQFIDFAAEGLLDSQFRFSPSLAKRWAELSKPLVPELREMVTRIANDIRPMIPAAKQFEFAKDLLEGSVAFDMYEKKMDRWAQGKVGDEEMLNIWSGDEGTELRATTTETGETRGARDARLHAARLLEQESSEWRRCVESAVKYYNLDAGQKQTAESILREMEERLKQIKTDEWTAKALLNRAKVNLSWYPGSKMNYLSNSPWMWRMDREYNALAKPIRDLTEELKERLDTLPTEDQRTVADKRVVEGFEKFGLRD